MSDLVAIINKGKLAQLGSPEEIYEYPQCKFVADFIGLSDFIPVCVESVDGSHTQVSFGETLLTAHSTTGLVPKQPVTLFIRPNDIVIATNGESHNILIGTVKQTTYLGDCFDYRVQVGNNLVVRVQANRSHRYVPGDPMRLHLPVNRCRLIAEE
jgi:ABC-type Fe3+/spermidine/putrescine transport system ATPase subunit